MIVLYTSYDPTASRVAASRQSGKGRKGRNTSQVSNFSICPYLPFSYFSFFFFLVSRDMGIGSVIPHLLYRAI